MSELSHFEEHPHALVRNNRVINVAVFAEHDEELINFIAQSSNADRVVCICNLGTLINIDHVYDKSTNTWTYVEPIEESVEL